MPPGTVFFLRDYLSDFRGTIKTNMLSGGLDKLYRDTILGHSLHGMDVRYLVPSEDVLHRAMGKYTAWLDGQIDLIIGPHCKQKS